MILPTAARGLTADSLRAPRRLGRHILTARTLPGTHTRFGIKDRPAMYSLLNDTLYIATRFHLPEGGAYIYSPVQMDPGQLQ